MTVILILIGYVFIMFSISVAVSIGVLSGIKTFIKTRNNNTMEERNESV